MLSRGDPYKPDWQNIIIDPADPSSAYGAILIFLFVMAVFFLLFVVRYMEDERMLEKIDRNFGRFTNWIVIGAVFLGLISLLFAYYPTFDYLWWNVTGAPYYKGMYNPIYGYGLLHIPSTILTMMVMLSAIISPAIAAGLFWLWRMVLSRLSPDEDNLAERLAEINE